MRSDGWRDRYLDGVGARVLVVTCSRCARYDRLLPDDMCAWRDATLDQVEAALDAGPGHVAGARASGQVGSGGVRRVRRWKLGLAAVVRVLLALLPGIAGAWLDRVREVVGPCPGALVRLRGWLRTCHRI